MSRTDISDYLVHWTKGDNELQAAETLLKIVLDMKLIGGTGFITGKHQCVCFTEAPVNVFHSTNRYMPFGVKLSKYDIYAIGGLPVIYQKSTDRLLLPDCMEWRHVTYNLIGPNCVDFTWEREWRVLRDEIILDSIGVKIIVPNLDWKNWLIDEWNKSPRSAARKSICGPGIPIEVQFPYQFELLDSLPHS